MTIPSFNSQQQSIAALWLVLISHPAEGRKLSWPLCRLYAGVVVVAELYDDGNIVRQVSDVSSSRSSVSNSSTLIADVTASRLIALHGTDRRPMPSGIALHRLLNACSFLSAS